MMKHRALVMLLTLSTLQVLTGQFGVADGAQLRNEEEHAGRKLAADSWTEEKTSSLYVTTPHTLSKSKSNIIYCVHAAIIISLLHARL
jgi:hypothetical protein